MMVAFIKKRLAGVLRSLANYLAPADDLESQLRALLASPTFKAVLKAVKKQESDLALQGADIDIKRAEALEWSEHYGTKKYARKDAWLTRFLVELAVGIEKGKIRV